MLPPVLSLILFGFAGLIAAAALLPQGAGAHISERVLSRLIARFGEPVLHPPADVQRAFHRGETLVVITREETTPTSTKPVLEITTC
ncbi:MAG: hypothetical protein AAGL90_13300 [Pseudomonadota bacterium]